MRNNIKLAGVEFSASEVSDALSDGKSFIAKGRKLYAIKTTTQGATYAQEVYNERGPMPLVARGRFCFMTAKQANKIIGFELCLA